MVKQRQGCVSHSHGVCVGGGAVAGERQLSPLLQSVLQSVARSWALGVQGNVPPLSHDSQASVLSVRSKLETNKMAQGARALVAKPDNLSSLPRTHGVPVQTPAA